MRCARRVRLLSVHGLAVALALLVVLSVPSKAFGQPSLPPDSGWPLAVQIQVLNGFNPPEQAWAKGHRGVDLAAAVGEEVLSAAAGTVTYAGDLAGRGVVVVDHGQLRTTYEPVAALVVVGARVAQGEVLGSVASGAHCGSRPCLHWGLRQGEAYLNPLLLAGGDTQVRLLPAAARQVAARRAADRAEAARRAAETARASGVATVPGAKGGHGFRLPVPGAVTSGFGRRFHPVLKVWKLHDGTDFAGACGTPIRAPFAGRVTRAYFNPGYGNRLLIDHGYVAGKRAVTSYNHAASYAVRAGAQVSRGQLIGFVGSTGYSTGCHLHLMVWLDGRLTNPLDWF